ncbi:L-threonylcarbamoyladenylate synthase [Devosia sp. YIM 151766]|uniref:L-threonylcarbamoyladenylate synthase n=1 Tax=Devosia sp. YIM 151766 TaxID=3017325 RepID=UPI00255C7510|nr:L-threonylcarbamoyladenylate synthase [Devosia sp. YIM 151766]WIY53394.1 L-threonylcarbamoyladenylate synthase [Devosia sp. YIM 151766]
MTAPDQKEIEDAAALLRHGRLVAFPTETVYGLGADATNSDAVLSIYETKGRPRFNPLIVHCADLAMAEKLALFSPLARRLAQAFWPGPLSIVLPLRPGHGLADITTAGLDRVALRVPDHPIAQALLRASGRPLAAPSANPSGRLSPTNAEQVRRGFAGNVPVLDGGACQAGVESTIIAVDGDRLIQLRAGALSRDEIGKVMNMAVERAAKGAEIAAPGMLLSHYAPNAALRLDTAPRPGEGWLAFGPSAPFEGITRNLSSGGDLREAARNLFAMLHELDASGVGVIAAAPIPETGLGEAINDRLRRAAAPRG